MSKNQKIMIVAVTSAIIIIVFLLVSLNSGSTTKSKTSLRERRNLIPKAEQTTTTTIATIPTTTKIVSSAAPVAPSENNFITGATYLDAPSIKTKWTEITFCSIVPKAEAKKLLAMTVEPKPIYIFSNSLGAKCTYTDGEGDEISFQFSNATFSSARTVDIAIGDVGENVVLENGANGVSKSSKSSGFTISLNLFGADLNEVLINAQDKETAIKVAIQVSNYFKINP